MAKILEALPEAIGQRGGRRAKYPYEEWFDGQPRELVGGDDFEVKPQSMIGNLRTAANRRGVEIVVGSSNGSVFLQATGNKPKATKKAAKK